MVFKGMSPLDLAIYGDGGVVCGVDADAVVVVVV